MAASSSCCCDVFAGYGTKQLFLSLDICSVLLKTPSVNIQPQNVETWLPLKSIFNSRSSPSLAPEAVQHWPLTSATLRSSLSFGPACREEMVGWVLSHPHTDLWATMTSGTLFGFTVVGELPSDDQTLCTLLTQAHSPLKTHTSYPVPTPPHLLLFSHTQTQTLHRTGPQSTSASTVLTSLGITSSLCAVGKCVWEKCLCDFLLMWAQFTYPVPARRRGRGLFLILTSSCLKARWRVGDITAIRVWKQDSRAWWTPAAPTAFCFLLLK